MAMATMSHFVFTDCV